MFARNVDIIATSGCSTEMQTYLPGYLYKCSDL